MILDCAEAKDYLDILALLRAGFSHERALGAAVALYGPAHQPAESLKALTFYGDGNLGTIGAEDRKFLSGSAASVRQLPQIAIVAEQLERAGEF